MKPNRFLDALAAIDTAPSYGHVTEVAPGLVRASGPAARLGQLCAIALSGRDAAQAEVVAASERGITLMPLENETGIALGARVSATLTDRGQSAGDGFAGRAIDALGRPIDGGRPIAAVERHEAAPVAPLDRASPAAMMATGIRAIDGLLTLGTGQRIGIFAASGVGKTSLVEQLATQIECDRCILCLVGERGREVTALWEAVGSDVSRDRFTVVAATSDESPVMRARAVDQALALAEHWRDRGEHVVLLVDSITRLAMALREIGLAAGAPPTVRAYTPNVFAALPRIVERCGAVRGGGAITLIATVLAETDDVDDPIVEVMKSLLDGHIVLSRSLADRGHFPAVDVVRSVSRQAARLIDADHLRMVRKVVGLLAAYDESRVMIESGVYRAGSNARIDAAIAAQGAIDDFLRQPNDQAIAHDAMLAALRSVAS